VIQVPIAALHKDPDPTSVRLDEGLHGMVVAADEQVDGYRLCEMSYGYDGLIAADQLNADPEIVARYSEKVERIYAPFADILSRPAYQGHVLATLPRGSHVVLLSEEGDYFKILLADGREGYTRKEHIDRRHIPEEEEALRQAIVETARRYLGVQYRWGGKTPAGIDCSGLTAMAYLLNDLVIYRDAVFMPEYGIREISLEEAKAGDLLFWEGHIALVIDGLTFIHSTGSAGGVVINNLIEGDPLCREDLRKTLQTVATYF
jgi:cell wall-associated NlpC family hydrolase